VIVFASSPVLTRLYEPEALGLFSIYTGMFTIIGSAAMGRYELAIVLPKNDSRAMDTVRLCAVLAICVSLLCLFLVLIGNRSIGVKFGFSDNQVLLIFLPLSVFFSASIISLRFWKIRLKAFQMLGIAGMLQSAGTVIFQILFALISSAGSFLLIMGQVIGQVASICYLLSKQSPFSGHSTSYSLRTRLSAVGRRYKDFPKQMLLAGFINQVSAYLPLFILSWRYSATIVGLFALSLRAIQVPMSIIGQSIGNAFLSKASELIKSDPNYLRKRSMQMVLVLFFLGLVPSATLLIWGPFLFGLIFGKEWTEAGSYSRILAFYLLFQFAFSPLSPLFTVMEKQKLYQLWEWIRLFLTGSALIIGSSFLKPSGALSVFTVAMIISYLTLGVLSFHTLTARCAASNP